MLQPKARCTAALPPQWSECRCVLTMPTSGSSRSARRSSATVCGPCSTWLVSTSRAPLPSPWRITLLDDSQPRSRIVSPCRAGAGGISGRCRGAEASFWPMVPALPAGRWPGRTRAGCLAPSFEGAPAWRKRVKIAAPAPAAEGMPCGLARVLDSAAPGDTARLRAGGGAAAAAPPLQRLGHDKNQPRIHLASIR